MDGLAGGGDTIPDCDRSIYFFPAGPSLSMRSNNAASTPSQVDRTCPLQPWPGVYKDGPP